jgi:hypothetical protein
VNGPIEAVPRSVAPERARNGKNPTEASGRRSGARRRPWSSHSAKYPACRYDIASAQRCLVGLQEVLDDTYPLSPAPDRA